MPEQGGISAAGLGLTVAGIVLLWSGIRGKSVSTVLKDVISGKNPGTAAVTSPLSNSTGLTDTGGIVAYSGTASKQALSFSAVEQLWIQAGGPAALAPVMAAISTAESGRIPGNVQQGQPYATTGWGLWQITPGNSEPQFGTDQQLLVPINNAHAAVAKYHAGGLGQWTTYTSGEYQQYLGGG